MKKRRSKNPWKQINHSPCHPGSAIFAVLYGSWLRVECGACGAEIDNIYLSLQNDPNFRMNLDPLYFRCDNHHGNEITIRSSEKSQIAFVRCVKCKCRLFGILKYGRYFPDAEWPDSSAPLQHEIWNIPGLPGYAHAYSQPAPVITDSDIPW